MTTYYMILTASFWKGTNYGDSKRNQWFLGAGRGGGTNMQRDRGLLGQCNYSVGYTNGGYTPIRNVSEPI